MSTTKSNLPTAGELRATVDATGVVNLSRLCDLCVESVRAIHPNAYGEGNFRRSRGALAKRVRRHLEAHGFDHVAASRWFHDQPRAIFELEQNAENGGDE